MKTVALIIAASVCATAMSAPSVRSRIDKQYKRWATAALTNDVETILSILAPDYTLKTYTGTVITHDKYEASLRKRRADKKPSAAYVTKMAGIQVAGTQAQVISDETSDTFSADPISNQKLKLIHIHRYLDTWTRIGHDWRLRSTVTQMEKTTVVPLTQPARS